MIVWLAGFFRFAKLTENIGLPVRHLLCFENLDRQFYLTKRYVWRPKYFTLHLIRVGKLKRFKKVSSDLKTILKTDLATPCGSKL